MTDIRYPLFEDVFQDLDINPEDISFEEEITNSGDYRNPSDEPYELNFVIQGIRRSKIYEKNVARMQKLYRIWLSAIDMLSIVGEHSDGIIVLRSYSKDVPIINDYRGMLIYCEEKFLYDDKTIIDSYGYKRDTVFNTPFLTFKIGVKPVAELNNPRLCYIFLTEMIKMWQGVVKMVFGSAATAKCAYVICTQQDGRRTGVVNISNSDIIDYENRDMRYFKKFYENCRMLAGGKIDKKKCNDFYKGIKQSSNNDKLYELERYADLLNIRYDKDFDDSTNTYTITLHEYYSNYWKPQKPLKKIYDKFQKEGINLVVNIPQHAGMKTKASSIEDITALGKIIKNPVAGEIDIYIQAFDHNAWQGIRKIDIDIDLDTTHDGRVHGCYNYPSDFYIRYGQRNPKYTTPVNPTFMVRGSLQGVSQLVMRKYY